MVSNDVLIGGVRSDHIIEITMRGRTFESKNKLYETVIKNLGQNPGINGNDIRIVLYKPPMKNWSVKGGKLASEVYFSFKIDI